MNTSLIKKKKKKKKQQQKTLPYGHVTNCQFETKWRRIYEQKLNMGTKHGKQTECIVSIFILR